MSIVRNTDGFSALPASDPLANLDMGDPRKWAILREDFLAFDTTLLVGGNPYTLTQTNGTLGFTSPNGIMTLTLGGADNDSAQLQGTGIPHALVSGKRMYIEGKCAIALASSGVMTAGEFFFGLAGQQTTTNFMNAGGTALTVDNCVGFVKYDAIGTLSSVARKSDVESSDAVVATPVDGTFLTLAIYFDGINSLYFYVNGNQVSRLTGDFPTAGMTPTFFHKAGEAKANVLRCDYYMIASER